MLVLELEFTNDTRRLEARPAHRQRLQGLQADGRLIMAGPWADDSGAMLVFDTDDDGMQAILSEDPYYSTPGVTVASIRTWTTLVLNDRSPTSR